MTVLGADTLDRLCWQLHLLYRAGLPSEESLALLAEETPVKGLAGVYRKISGGLSAGGTFSQSAADTGVFPAHMLSMLEIGENTGRMEQVLASLSEYYRREAETQSSLRRAVTYPAVMAALISVVFSILLVRVLPVFGRVFEQMGVVLPPLTRALLSAGNASMYVAAGLCALLLATAAILLGRVGRGKPLPVGKKTRTTLEQSRFSSAMALMLRSALPLEEALARTAALLEGTALAEKVTESGRLMAEGATFARALDASGVLGPLQTGILAAGVRAGAADDAMDEVSARCLFDAEEALHSFITRFEFTLVAVLCLSIGLVLLSVMLPLIGILASLG